MKYKMSKEQNNRSVANKNQSSETTKYWIGLCVILIRLKIGLIPQEEQHNVYLLISKRMYIKRWHYIVKYK